MPRLITDLDFTPTEENCEILQLTADGLTQYEIGAKVHMVSSSVSNRVRYMQKNYGFNSRVHLIAEAMRRGWIK